jgi:AraC-like DNA-binding protein
MMMVGCTDSTKNQKTSRVPQPTDTLYTQQAAMSIYAYQPEKALRIVDSAVIVGNMSEWRADLNRARIYSSTQMFDQMDSLLGGSKNVRFDSARAIGERLLRHDSVKADMKRQLDVLEALSYSARMQNDTTGWLQRSREFVDICHLLGDSQKTNALRTEAEIGAALCAMGKQEQGMAKLDSVIYQLDVSFHRENDRGTFDELDALIIALKRKIVQLASHDKYAETVPLARLIIERLDDYEQHPGDYHDGTYREPKNDQKRADYIRFYRTQAQNYIIAAYASLGERGSMLDAFEEIERSVRETTAREHIARYNALQQQMEAVRQQEKAHRSNLIAIIVGIFALLLLVFSVIILFKNRAINRKNRLLAKQIASTVDYKEKYWEEKQNQQTFPNDISDISALTDEELFKYINDVIVSERLFLDPKFDRQTIMDRFQLSKEKVGAVFSKGSKHAKMTNYVQQLRLEYAAKLLVEEPDKSIVQIAAESGFSSNAYFSNCFRQYFSMSPSVFRKDVSDRTEI